MIEHHKQTCTDTGLVNFLDSVARGGGTVVHIARHQAPPHIDNGRVRVPDSYFDPSWSVIWTTDQVDPKQQLADDVVAILGEPVNYAGNPSLATAARIAKVRERIMR